MVSPRKSTRRNPALWCAVYVRISRDREGRELGVTRQEKLCRDLAKRTGLKVAAVYSDNDISASTMSRKPRPDFQRMLADARAGATFGTIAAYSTSRLTRRPMENETLIELFQETGIRYAFVASPMYDLNTAAGRMIARQLAAADAAEAEQNSERAKEQKRQAAQMGLYRGSRRPFGYRDGGMKLDPAESKALRQAYDDVLGGLSGAAIARKFNTTGLRTTPTKGHPDGKAFDGMTVHRILLRPRNAALVEYQGELLQTPSGEYVRGKWKPVVSVETWMAVRAILTDPSRRTNPGSTRRWFAPGIALCGECAKAGVRSPVKSMSDRRNVSYVCRRDVSHIARRADITDEYLTELVLERLARPDAQKLLADDGPDRAHRARLTRDRATKAARVKELGDMWEAGEITRAERLERKERIEREIAEIDDELRTTTRVPALGRLLEAEDLREAWDHALTLDERRAVLDTLMVVTLHKGGRGRPKGWKPGQRYFDYDSVQIDWRTT